MAGRMGWVGREQRLPPFRKAGGYQPRKRWQCSARNMNSSWLARCQQASQQLLVRWRGGRGSPRPHMHVRGETPTVGFFQWATIEAQSRISNRFQIPRNRSRETEGKVRKMSQQITNCAKHIPKTRTRDFCHGPEFSFPSFQNSDQSQQITKCAEHIPSTQKIPYAEFCRLLVKWQISKTKNGTSQSEMGCVDADFCLALEDYKTSEQNSPGRSQSLAEYKRKENLQNQNTRCPRIMRADFCSTEICMNRLKNSQGDTCGI